MGRGEREASLGVKELQGSGGPKARGLLSSSPTGTFSKESGSIPKHKDLEDIGKSEMGELSDLAEGNPRADIGRAWMGLGM